MNTAYLASTARSCRTSSFSSVSFKAQRLLRGSAASFHRWIIIGAGFGAIFRAYGVTAESSNLSTDALITFDEELFLYVLLQPIIFEAGFTLSKSHFFSNLATILLFAVVGTLASTFCIGQAIYSLGSSGIFRSSPRGTHDALDFGTPLDSYLFGALISATDPVATLSIMGPSTPTRWCTT